VIDHIVSGQDCIALLPTGAGKSICYQVAGLLREGLTIVVSPLIALMLDQVENLKKRGISAVCLHGGMHRADIDRELENAIYGKYDFLYLSPERLQTEIFQARRERMNLSLIAIDEAHCISQWGHDFRPSYLTLDKLKEWFPSVPISAFTATATNSTLKDIKKYLQLEKATVYRKSFAKENLSYTVIKSTEKKAELLYLLRRLSGAGIIYARNRRKCESIASFLLDNSYEADYYHAGLDHEKRTLKQKNWTEGKTQIIVSTNAFGMGIDKSDVRWVIHIDIPPSIEEYYQEAGRAGRDGKMSHAIHIYDDKDIEMSISNMKLTQVDNHIINSIYEKLHLFYNIPLGGGEGESYDFDLNAFSRSHKIPLFRTLSAVKVLMDYRLIYVSESFFKPSTLQFHISRERIIREQSGSSYYPFLLALLRNYEGLFNYPTKISEEKIMRIMESDYRSVVNNLERINAMELGEYSPRKTVPQIKFEQPRYEAKSLPIDYSKLLLLNENKQVKLDAQLQFMTEDTCRERRILSYFDEKSSKNCGRCDICLNAHKAAFDHKEVQSFYSYLKERIDKELSLVEVLHWWPYNKRRKTLAMLSFLENEGKLVIENRKLRFS